MIDMDRYPHDQEPTRFSLWDVAGVASYTAGTMLNVLDDGLRILSRVFFAAAEDSRARRELRDMERNDEMTREAMARALDAGTVDFRPEELT